MKNKNWNPDDWQGRSKKSVEDTMQALAYLSIFLLSIGVGWIILTVLSKL